MAVFRKDIDRKDIDKDVILNPIKTLTHRLIMFRWTFYTTSVWFLISKDHVDALLMVGWGCGLFRGPILPHLVIYHIFSGIWTKLLSQMLPIPHPTNLLCYDEPLPRLWYGF